MEKKLLTIKEACEYLNLSRATIYKLIKEGKLTPIKIGRSTRLDKSDLDAFVESMKKGDKTKR
jgi:excisionase family DNA binding protein